MSPARHYLYVKRVYDPAQGDDGARILIDRLWPRGIRKEQANLTLWLKDIAPSADLRKWFHHDPSRWPEFERRYFLELSGNEPAVAQVGDFLEQGTVTLLYAAHDTQHNHARILASYLRERFAEILGG